MGRYITLLLFIGLVWGQEYDPETGEVVKKQYDPETGELIKDQNYPDSLVSPSHPKVNSDLGDSNTGKPKETSGNEEKVSRLDGILSFKNNPIILKKGDDEILINPGEKIKVITTDGNIVIGMYYKISILKKEIIVSRKKKSKIYYEDIKEISYEDIKEISRGIGNKSVEYGITGAVLGTFGGFVLGSIIVGGGDAYRGVMGALYGVAGGISGLVVGLSTGFSTPIDFEEPITIGENEWKIITEYDE